MVLPLLLLAAAVGQADAPAPNPLLTELLEKGVPIAEGVTVKLPPPLLQGEPDAKATRAALEKAADRLPFELFIRKSEAAPFTLKINSVTDKKEQRLAQTVDLWFIAFGKLESAGKRDILNQILAGERGPDKGVEFLTAEQLRQRGIKPLNEPGLEERFATLDIAFLDKVRVTGITRNLKSGGSRALVLAMKLDERFANDKEHSNRWRSVNKVGDKGEELGPPQPYHGLAGYVCLTELSEPAGALLVELHFAFQEPPAWFGGPNLLRSKLPIVVQENVRTFRRKLSRD